jgi:hypothetical protein
MLDAVAKDHPRKSFFEAPSATRAETAVASPFPYSNSKSFRGQDAVDRVTAGRGSFGNKKA